MVPQLEREAQLAPSHPRPRLAAETEAGAGAGAVGGCGSWYNSIAMKGA